MNPLLSDADRIPFDRIETAHVEPAVREALATAKRRVEAIVAAEGDPSYERSVGALADLIEDLQRVVSIAYHLTMVDSSPELRSAFNVVYPEYTAFMSRLATNPGLWRVIRAFAQSDAVAGLDTVRQRQVRKMEREFVRSGADLPPEGKARIEAIQVELSKLQTKFSENVLDATNAFELVLTDEARLAGLPESARSAARANAEAKGLDGWRFTLQVPSYLPFLRYSDHRVLRERLYRAYVHRATSGETDNRPLLRRILELRREQARLLGYDDFADYRLEDNMIRTGAEAVAFERELADRTDPYWRVEIDRLEAFARDELGLARLQPWDVYYAVEKLRKATFDLDQEELRPYFSLDRVLDGLFEITGRLFGIRVREVDLDASWHPEVRFYEVRDAAGALLGSFYADWFPRESKRAGAWKYSFRVGGPLPDGGFEPHLAVIVANFTEATADRPALLTHDEVRTVFHEFGHLLHHVLSRVEVRSLGGTQVARDWVELPSQLLENWIWERDALDLFARHHRTGEPIPDELYARLAASRTFMEANAQMRQLSFGTVDLALHIDFDPDGDTDPVAFANRVMERFAIRPDFAHDAFVASFSHVFAGGYACGYYSYKWSEVLEADAFRRFRDEGIFNRETGRDFVDAVLARGDSEDPAVLFEAFMGRGPDLEALLERNLGPGPVAPVAGD